MSTIEYRDVRPDGTLLMQWRCAAGQEIAACDYGQFGPDMWPEPPYDTQRREPGSEWVTVSRVLADGQGIRHQKLASDGSVTSDIITSVTFT